MKYVDPEFFTEQTLTVLFRWCKPGEYQNGNVWIKLGIGSYSVIWDETQWHNWPNNAVCEGETISLSSGYWRMDANSTDIMEWPNSNDCIGGYNNQSIYPVYWATEYKGILWDEWVKNYKEKYEKIIDSQWSKWPDPSFNLSRVIGFGILILIFLIIIIL